MNSKTLSGLLIISILFFGCIDPTPIEQQILDDSKATTTGVNQTVKENNEFALEMYSKLNKEEKNLFFSPWSISSALAMTYEGAKGQTAKEMQEVLHLQENNLDRRSGFAKIYNLLNKNNSEYQLSTANALWAQKNYPFLEEYINTTKKYYSAEFTNMDFVNKAEKERKTINSWVEKKTQDKIKDLIPEGTLTSLTRLVLTNAIYFKGDWTIQFDKTKTKKQDFKVNDSTTVQADMMSLKKGPEKFNYTETNELQMLEMSYKGNDLSMIVLLPKNSMQELEQELSAEKLIEWKESMHEREVYVYFPKFTFETKYFIADNLSEMGMPTAFSETQADFTGMYDKSQSGENLFISHVIHQAFVQVDEKGTEAAAATAVIMKTFSMPIQTEFKADHPFIFLIQENSTGRILFMGKVVNPTAE